MTMPWYRPKEDVRATRPEPLASAGFGGRRQPPDPPAPGAIVAMTIGVVTPLSLALWILYRLRAPLFLWLLVGGAIVAPIVVQAIRARASRRRSDELFRRFSEANERNEKT